SPRSVFPRKLDVPRRRSSTEVIVRARVLTVLGVGVMFATGPSASDSVCLLLTSVPGLFGFALWSLLSSPFVPADIVRARRPWLSRNWESIGGMLSSLAALAVPPEQAKIRLARVQQGPFLFLEH
ncbi:unnamed protein product, partial [Ectocarpus sp. 12 AP-2014]